MKKAIIILIVLMTSCKKEGKHKGFQANAEKFNTYIKDSLQILDNVLMEGIVKDYTTLSVPPPDNQELNLKDVLKSINFVKLETTKNNKIGEVDKLLFNSEYFFILDSKIAKLVYVFDSKGKFITKLGDRGKGPGEYMNPVDITINKEKQWVIILDTSLKKFLYYDFSGKFVKEHFYNPLIMFGADTFKHYKDNKFLVSSTNKQTKYNVFPALSQNLRIVNTEDQVISRHFKQSENNAVFSFTSKEMFFNFKNAINYAAVWENSIYEIADEKIKLKYKIDFGSEGIPQSLLDRFANSDFFETKDYDERAKILFEAKEEIENRKYSFAPSRFLETEQFIYFTYIKDKSSIPVFYNKNSGSVFSSSKTAISLENDISSFYVPSLCYPVGLNNKEEFIGILQPFDLHNRHKAISNVPQVWSTIKEKKEMYKDYFHLLNSVGVNDNPVIAIWELNDF